MKGRVMMVCGLISLAVMGIKAGALNLDFQGKWQVVENACSHGGLNKAAVPTLLKSKIQLSYEFNKDVFKAVISLIELPTPKGLESCEISFSGYFASVAGGLKFLEVSDAVNDCQHIKSQDLSNLVENLLATVEVGQTEDYTQMVLVNKKADLFCDSGAMAVTYLKRLN